MRRASPDAAPVRRTVPNSPAPITKYADEYSMIRYPAARFEPSRPAPIRLWRASCVRATPCDAMARAARAAPAPPQRKNRRYRSRL
jgi:hypothetical protein